MKLTKVHVTEFQSILDSTEFDVGDVTCLVGKNEAGKTALLRALYRLNPIVPEDGDYSVTDDYPRWNVEDYRLAVEGGGRQHATVARAVFELDKPDIAAVEAVFGAGALVNTSVTIWKGYDNQRYFSLNVDDVASLRYLVGKREFTPEAQGELEKCDTVEKMATALDTLEGTEDVVELKGLVAQIQKEGELSHYIFKVLLWPRVPRFLYFDEYYQMKGHAQIEALKERMEKKKLDSSDHPMLGLINLARLNLDALLNPARTRELKNALEGAGNHLTKRVVKYWSQNRYLELRFDVRPGRPEDPEGMRSGTNIWSDVYDSKHRVTTELGTRSSGFVWFFSFLAWYSQLCRKSEKLILLLDEPGLSLHAKAQGDLLRYFEEELKDHNQVIYSTHSPFMVDPTHFDRVRIVQDLSIEPNSQDLLDATPDSLFPLQGALGYEIYQTLFIGPNSLVVEGSSDLLYIQTISALLQARGEAGLSCDWTITPVGGSDKVATFVAMIGAQKHLNVAVLIDYQKKDRQSIKNLYKKKLLKKKQILTYADFVSGDEADIEDMFDAGLYLKLVNGEFGSSVAVGDILEGPPRILVRLEQHFVKNPLPKNVGFNHYRPARYFAENIATLESELAEPHLDCFRQAFKAVNALL